MSATELRKRVQQERNTSRMDVESPAEDYVVEEIDGSLEVLQTVGIALVAKPLYVLDIFLWFTLIILKSVGAHTDYHYAYDNGWYIFHALVFVVESVWLSVFHYDFAEHRRHYRVPVPLYLMYVHLLLLSIVIDGMSTSLSFRDMLNDGTTPNILKFIHMMYVFILTIGRLWVARGKVPD